jgi:hypothetical protein
MPEMNKQNIETESTLALVRLRSQVNTLDDELATVIVMKNICDALAKDNYGEWALKALLDLWRELKLKDISKASILELQAVVNYMHRQSINESKASPSEPAQ